mgnify:CR=1 FL=1
MKTIHKLIFLFCILALTLNSCSSDDDEKNDIPVVKETPEIIISEESISVIVDKETNVEITQGGSEYNAFSLNPEIADVKIEDNQMTIAGKSGGNTFIIVSDQNGQYKKYPVTAYYDKLTLDQEHVDIEIPNGTSGEATVRVLLGNGEYSATSDNNEILSTSISGNYIVITAIKEGDATITIRDVMGMEGSFTVHTTVSTSPYTKQELENIKNNSNARYEFEGYKIGESIYYIFENSIENGMNKYGWRPWSGGDAHLTIWFTGDKSVGKKEQAFLSQFTWEDYTTQYTNEPITFEIIKNDGKKIWAVYTVQSNGKSYGYFCAKI